MMLGKIGAFSTMKIFNLDFFSSLIDFAVTESMLQYQDIKFGYNNDIFLCFDSFGIMSSYI